METIVQAIEKSYRHYGDKEALRQKVNGQWCGMTYAELWRQSNAIASGLQAQGFTIGFHAGLLAAASPWWMVAYLGILKAGGVVVPIDKELKAAEMRHILMDSGASCLFTTQEFLDALFDIQEDLTDLQRIVLIDPIKTSAAQDEATMALHDLLHEWETLLQGYDLPPESVDRIERAFVRAQRLLLGPEEQQKKKSPVHAFLQTMKKIRYPVDHQAQVMACADFVRHKEPEPVKSAAEETAVILYTSGTTGRSKGAMLSHRNLLYTARTAAASFDLDDSTTTLSCLPVNHVFEQVLGLLLPLSLGGTVSFAESLKKVGQNLAEVEPTFFLGVPALYRMMYSRIENKINEKVTSRWMAHFAPTRRLMAKTIKKTLGGETVFASGGAALDPEIVKGLAAFGIRLYQGYGITETSPLISNECPGLTRLGSVGPPIKGVQVRIDQPNSQGIGEIVVKGPNVMQGYYNNPQATAEVLKEGWYSTGDLGRLDEDGFLTVCGRVKSLIVTPNGKNVYPEEVENELLKSPFIAEVMVYGHKIGATGEEVCAIIYPDHKQLDQHAKERKDQPLNRNEVETLIKQELLEYGRRLADYKRVKRFTLREDEFPKTSTRKIKRYVVEADIAAEE